MTDRRKKLIELSKEKGFNPTFVDGLQAVDFWYTLWLGNMQRWFRENYKIHIEVNVHSCSKPECFEYSVSILKGSYGEWKRVDSHLKYEDSLEHGLLEALKLI